MPRRPGLLALLALASVGLAACGTTERAGAVGDTLEAGHLRVSLDAIDRTVPQPARDLTGLSRAAPGHVLIGAHVTVCNGTDAAIGITAFDVDVDGGGGRAKFPQHSYPDRWDGSRSGCHGGWIVLEVPAGRRVERLRFRFDNTRGRREAGRDLHARLRWRL